MATATRDMIDTMVNAIVKEINPKQVILFGSRAREDARFDSDIDFLIVQDTQFAPENTRRKLLSRLWRRLAHESISQDFLIYTPEEIERYRNYSGHIVAHALKEGILLYERD